LSISLPERSDTKIVLRAIAVSLNRCSDPLGDPRSGSAKPRTLLAF
jgi:hypothetical protein